MRPVPRTSKLRILRLDTEIGWESAPYNHFSLPLAREQEITYATYFPAPIRVGPEVELVEADGTLRGYFRRMRELLTTRRFDLVHAHTPHVATLYLALRGMLGGPDAPVVFTLHNCYSSYKRRNKLLLLPPFAGCDRVVCCSHASRRSLPALHARVAGRRLRVIQNGVDLDRVDRAVAATVRQDESFTVITVGRLIPIKSPSMALHAFGRAVRSGGRAGGWERVGDDDRDDAGGLRRGVRLVYVGEGPLREPAAREAGRLGLADRVEFTGRIRRDEVYGRVGAADLFLSTSRGEGLPVAVLEAMAAGCPAVLSDIEPHREIAGGVPDIPLIDPDDEEGFAREIERFRAMPAARRAEIGRRCREVVASRFSLRRMLDRYLELYDELVGAPERRAAVPPLQRAAS